MKALKTLVLWGLMVSLVAFNAAVGPVCAASCVRFDSPACCMAAGLQHRGSCHGTDDQATAVSCCAHDRQVTVAEPVSFDSTDDHTWVTAGPVSFSGAASFVRTAAVSVTAPDGGTTVPLYVLHCAFLR